MDYDDCIYSSITKTWDSGRSDNVYKPNPFKDLIDHNTFQDPNNRFYIYEPVKGMHFLVKGFKQNIDPRKAELLHEFYKRPEKPIFWAEYKLTDSDKKQLADRIIFYKGAYNSKTYERAERQLKREILEFQMRNYKWFAYKGMGLQSGVKRRMSMFIWSATF